MKIKIALLFISNILFAQQRKEILTTIDSTKFKIGEEINAKNSILPLHEIERFGFKVNLNV